MANEHRKRKRKFSVYLDQHEFDLLEKKSIEAKTTKTNFVRNVILYGSARPETNFSDERARGLLYEINRIGNNINQIAYRVNSRGGVSEEEFYNLAAQYSELLGLYSELALC